MKLYQVIERIRVSPRVLKVICLVCVVLLFT